jgi:MFS family permease
MNGDGVGGMSKYVEVMRVPGARATASASLLARLPNGMASVGIVLFVHQETGTFATAGVVAGGFIVGLGITGPLLSRLVDRRGPRPVVVVGGLLGASALVLLYLLGRSGAGPGVLVAVAALAGAASPPIGSVVRRRWQELVAPPVLPTAYAVEAMMLDVIFIVGPALAGLLASTLGPGAALLVAAGAGAIGTLWFGSLCGSADAQSKRSTRDVAGALRFPIVGLLMAIGAPLGAASGMVEIALPAFGASTGSASLGGALVGCVALGSLLGGLMFGMRPDGLGDAGRALRILSVAMVPLYVPMALVDAPAAMVPAAVLAGVCWAPSMASRSRILQEGVELSYLTEAFTWEGLSMTIGVSAGSAFGGPLVSSLGWRSGAVAACLFALVGALVAFLGRPTMERAGARQID